MKEKIPMQGLRRLREQKGMTQKDTAAALGVPLPTYLNYEYGTREAGYSELLRLANFFKCHVEDLFNAREVIKTDNEKNRPMFDADEVKEASAPLSELLKKKGCPHITAIVSASFVKIVSDEIGIPLTNED